MISKLQGIIILTTVTYCLVTSASGQGYSGGMQGGETIWQDDHNEMEDGNQAPNLRIPLIISGPHPPQHRDSADYQNVDSDEEFDDYDADYEEDNVERLRNGDDGKKVVFDVAKKLEEIESSRLGGVGVDYHPVEDMVIDYAHQYEDDSNRGHNNKDSEGAKPEQSVSNSNNFKVGSGGASAGGAADSTTPEAGKDGVKILHVPKSMEFFCNFTSAAGEIIDLNWSKDGELLEADERHVMSNPGKLLLLTTEDEDVGQFKCQANSNSSISRIFDVIQITYKNLPKSSTALEGDKLSLTCDAEGNPEPTITWTKDDMPLSEAVNDTSRLVYQTSEKGLANATIIITEIMQEDRGNYTCFITNYPGMVYSTSTNVRVKDIYAALWPFLGIVAEVVVLCLVIFIYEKHRSKNDFEESDTDQGTSK